MHNSTSISTMVASVLGGLAIIGFIIGLFWAIPVYNVWSKGKSGEAALRESESARKVLIEQAKAEKEANILRAEAEKEAAQLRADAIEIIGDAAKNYPEYRTQGFIDAFGQAMQNGNIQHQTCLLYTSPSPRDS